MPPASEPPTDPNAETTRGMPGAARSSSSAGLAAFAPTTLVAGRYRVIKLLGEGGMGEVYEVDDQLLRERVAMKTIRREVARDEITGARFKREIQLARKVTHPNICRIFDVGLHADAPFITMELLAGETLSARLKRGRPPLGEADDLARQLVAALAAAHDVGIIHRDLKSPNVMLVPRAGGRGVRVVVTDFGLARALEEDPTHAITGDGGVVGSPAYMAPEQVEGKPSVAAAADIYALGVILFELATGRLPFLGPTPLATMTLRLREPPPSPRSLVADLPDRWATTILRCLEREPARRFARVEEVGAALAAPAPAPARRHPRAILAAAALVAVAGSAAALWPRGHTEAPGEVAPRSGRPSIAVLAFENASGQGEDSYLSGLLAELVRANLAAGDLVRTVDAASIARARRDLGASATGDPAARLGARLHSDYVLVGSYAMTGDDGLRIDVHLKDAGSGATVAKISETGKKDDLLAVVARLSASVRPRLRVGEPSPGERASVAASLPQSSDAGRLYAEGAAQLAAEACSAARESLEQAVAAEPGFAAAHSALADALSCLGFDTQAENEAAQAVTLSAELPEEARLAAQARLDELEGAQAQALAGYAALFARAPDDAGYAQRLARAQLAAGKLDEARATLAALRKLPGGDSADTDLLAWLVAASAGEGTLAERHAGLRTIRARADAEEKRLVAAAVLLEQARIDLALGELGRGRAEAGEAKAIFQAVADHDGELQAMTVEVALLSRLGDDEGVRRLDERAQELVRTLDSGRAFHELETTLAATLVRKGDLAGARRVLGGLRDWARSHGRKTEEAGALLSLAGVQMDQADLAAAGQSLEEATALLAARTRRRGARRGVRPPEEARADAGGSLSLLYVERGRLSLLRADLVRARAQFEAFLALLPPSGSERETLEAQLRGQLADAEGHQAEAATLLGRWRELQVIKAGRPAAVASLPPLGTALLEQGKVQDAQALLGDVSSAERVAIAEDRGTALGFGAASAWLLATTGKPADADAQLRGLSAEARRDGFLLRALEIDYALGRAQLQTARRAAGRATLAAVAKEAGDLGLALLAARAELALR